MNKRVNVVLVLIFSSLGMGLYAQCDSMKSFDLERATEVNISLDPKDYPVTADDPTNPPQPPNPTEVRRIYFIHGLRRTHRPENRLPLLLHGLVYALRGFEQNAAEIKLSEPGFY